MNKGTPADPLRERLSAYLADAVEYKREWVPISLITLREIIAALATKPAEQPANDYTINPITGASRPKVHPTESAGEAAQGPAGEELCMCKDRALSECPGEWEPGCDLGANEQHARRASPDIGDKVDASLGFSRLTSAQLNHLRLLLGWVACEIGQTPEEMQATMKEVAGGLPGVEIDDAAKGRFVSTYQKISDTPKYVRAAVKALRKVVYGAPRKLGAVERVERARLPEPPPTASGFSPEARGSDEQAKPESGVGAVQPPAPESDYRIECTKAEWEEFNRWLDAREGPETTWIATPPAREQRGAASEPTVKMVPLTLAIDVVVQMVAELAPQYAGEVRLAAQDALAALALSPADPLSHQTERSAGAVPRPTLGDRE